MQTLIVDTLKVWREAERVLHDLSPVHANHEAVRLLVIELRGLYAELSKAPAAQPAETVARYRAQLEQTRQRLSALRPDA